MPYLAVATAIVGLLCLLDLVLTVGLIRRLREVGKALAERPAGGPALGANVMTPSGSRPDDFTVTTVDGEVVTRDTLAVPTLVAFLTPGCKPCEAALPELVRYASALPGGREHVLAMVSDGEDAEKYAERLRGVARVVVEWPDGPLVTAFAAHHFPSFALLGDGGTVSATALRVADLPAPVAA